VPFDDEITPAQISGVLQEAKTKNIHIDRAKIVGGEPLLCSSLVEIVELLIRDGIESGVVGSIKLDTNGIAALPSDLPKHPNFRVGGRKPKKKIHLPFLWSPRDLNIESHGPCSHPSKCGFSLDGRGWLPCSPAIMIDRLFYGERHYRDEIPTRPWGCDELCVHCLYSTPEWFRERWATPIRQFTPEMRMPTRSWATALRNAGIHVEQVYEPQVI